MRCAARIAGDGALAGVADARLVGPGPSLAEKVACLRSGSAYPERTRSVESIETHMSWVFLTDRHAYKLKKPVRHPFLDFSTAELRRLDCQEEVRLNARLAPGVYLDVVALAADEGGGMRIGASGAPVDWLVRMRRLPRQRMLDAVIARGALTEADLESLAGVLAEFYRRCIGVPLSIAEYRERLRREIPLSARELSRCTLGLPVELVERVATRLSALVEGRPDFVEPRVRSGRIVEGHGDLRPEHVCLLPVPVVIDCLEFNRDLRLVDVADELAHLAMECERLGAAAAGNRIFERVSASLGDAVPAPLKALYGGYRAFTRARIAAWHTADAAASERPKWTGRAGEYLALADRYAAGG